MIMQLMIDALNKAAALGLAALAAATVLFSPGLSLAYAASAGYTAGTGGRSASRNNGVR